MWRKWTGLSGSNAEPQLLEHRSRARLRDHRQRQLRSRRLPLGYRALSAAIWVGYAYWNVSKVVAGTIPVEGLGDLSFAVKYQPIEPSNMLLGGRLVLFDRVDLVLDYGVWKDVTTVTGQVSIRF